MVKYFKFDPEVIYPDYGCNNEVYVNGNLLEIETLGPVTGIPPGKYSEHTEDWYLKDLENNLKSDSEHEIDLEILPLVKELNT